MTPFFSTLLGACIGSFLNVCLSRWKSGASIIYPPSQCPQCHRSILWYDNIPLFSFLFLKAKCRFCRGPISWSYPAVEAVTALLFGLSSVRFQQEKWFLLPTSFFFVGFMVLLGASDLNWKLLPHPFTNGFILAGLLSPVNGAFFSLADRYHAVSHFVLIGFILFGTSQIIPNGLGGGDIKMGAGLAVWLGLSKTIFALFLAFGAGFLVAIPLLWRKKITRKSMIPFGPFLAFGSLVVWFWPDVVTQWGIDL